jgi:dTDP-4-dehydrorhamnose reductase
MRVLILGATGMLGHKLMQILSAKFEVIGTIRDDPRVYSDHPILGRMNLIGNIRADNIGSIRDAVDNTKPDVVINCIGIVKQLPVAQDAITSITVNALFPHQLAKICQSCGIRLIHYSTDCVFSGSKGNYHENDVSDASDLYGRTKYLGEISYGNCLTLRTSLIGRELLDNHSLVEWFISQNGGTVKGFKKAIFSGLTTKAHGIILSQIISRFPEMQGLWHLSADPISKYDLLTLIKNVYQLDVEIVPDYSVSCDRSLNSTKFRKNTAISIPGWNEMITEMYHDERVYESLREHYDN